MVGPRGPGGGRGRGGGGGAGRAWRGARPGLRGSSAAPAAGQRCPGTRGRRRESRRDRESESSNASAAPLKVLLVAGRYRGHRQDLALESPLTRGEAMARSAGSVPPRASDDHTPLLHFPLPQKPGLCRPSSRLQTKQTPARPPAQDSPVP
ncbi:translation initiation factor IF-2-like [Vidua macroura]|uniref:translation initiation factor IF-2-like n=1 Tax=Vidua macroura TaxID=187451 RepID=UPI0023A8EA6D|nr:translation initiation factor IF-2-like [Vidua macroura]